MKTQQKTRGDYLRELLNDYIKAHGDDPVEFATVYRWAKRENRWEPPATSQLKTFKAEMARAAREEHYTDPQNREVRKKHAVVTIREDGTQLSLWADIETAPPEHMRLSLQQRRRGVFGDVKQLKTDMDSYNENNNPMPDQPIQMSFNFDEDLAEVDQDSTYSDTPPEDVEPPEEG